MLFPRKLSLEEATWEEPSTNLVFLPAGVKLSLGHSAEILSSIQLKKLFEKLREKYDYVVVDLPPLGADCGRPCDNTSSRFICFHYRVGSHKN